MQVAWFFATTPAPTPVAPPIVRRTGWWTRLAARYVAWAERSNAQLHQRAAGR